MNLPWEPFVTVWSLLAVNILSPGPNVLNTIATAMGSGRVAGIGSALGVGFGIGIWCLSMALGMAGLFTLFPVARILLTAVAIGLLTYFALRYLVAARAGYSGQRRGLPGEREGLTLGSGFRRSLLVNAMNPKALTTWLAILAIFPAARAGAGDMALLCVGACALSFTIHTGYALAFSTVTAARIYLRWAWAISGATGLFFLGFAARIAAGLVRTAG